MSDETDRTAARAELVGLIQPTSSPVLSETGDGNDVDTILDRHRRSTTWAAETEYQVGDVVMPIVRNGRRYLCVRAGTSGDEEPTHWPKRQGAKLAEGESDPQLVWAEDGPGFENIYDVRAAAHDAWTLRATRSAGKFNLSLGGQRFNRSEVYEHCVRMAASFAPVNFG